jgi:beta-lactamase class A
MIAVDRLKAHIEELFSQSGGEVGVAVEHLETGSTFSINGNKSFPMASTYKVGIAAYALYLVDRGVLSLEQMIEIDTAQHVVASPIARHFQHQGISLSLHNLLEVMLTESDNTASDVVLTLVGGGKSVTKWLSKMNIENIRVDRSTASILRDYFSLPTPKDKTLSIKKQLEAFYAEQYAATTKKFDPYDYYDSFENDSQDQATPKAMNQLLGKIWRNEILSESGSDKLRNIMLRCATGDNRLKGRLPIGSEVAHKTGTIFGTVNDVGVITLPGDRGTILISVFIKNSRQSMESKDMTIADIARSIYDFYAIDSSSNKRISNVALEYKVNSGQMDQ